MKEKFLVFYPVVNNLDYDRHSFDGIDDDNAFIMLDDLGVARFYSFDSNIWNLNDFINDYNDEILDGGWWSIYLEVNEEVVEAMRIKEGFIPFIDVWKSVTFDAKHAYYVTNSNGFNFQGIMYVWEQDGHISYEWDWSHLDKYKIDYKPSYGVLWKNEAFSEYVATYIEENYEVEKL